MMCVTHMFTIVWSSALNCNWTLRKSEYEFQNVHLHPESVAAVTGLALGRCSPIGPPISTDWGTVELGTTSTAFGRWIVTNVRRARQIDIARAADVGAPKTLNRHLRFCQLTDATRSHALCDESIYHGRAELVELSCVYPEECGQYLPI